MHLGDLLRLVNDHGSHLPVPDAPLNPHDRICARKRPERGGENDRSPRGESYVKDFAKMSVGRLHLDAGKSRLTLRATEIPGSQVMDFRLIMLTKVDNES